MQNEAKHVLAGFLTAEYGVDGATMRVLTIDETIASGCSRAWITAFNPLGQVASDAANVVAQEQMCAALRDAGLKFEHGYARSPAFASGPTWFEPCAVVLNPPLAFIDALARTHRQLAIVVAGPGEPARLRCYRDCWIERFGVAGMNAADIDAAQVDWIA